MPAITIAQDGFSASWSVPEGAATYSAKLSGPGLPGVTNLDTSNITVDQDSQTATFTFNDTIQELILANRNGVYTLEIGIQTTTTDHYQAGLTASVQFAKLADVAPANFYTDNTVDEVQIYWTKAADLTGVSGYQLVLTKRCV